MITCIVLVSLVPLGFLGAKVYEKTWENAHREVVEKHLLLAQNLIQPLKLYMQSQIQGLQMLANNVQVLNAQGIAKHQQQLKLALNTNKNYRAITMLSPNGTLLAHQNRLPETTPAKLPDYSKHPAFKSLLNGKQVIVSGNQPSLLDSKPSILIGHARYDDKNTLQFILLAEVDIAPVEAMRSQVKFGKRGHCAIVDHTGKVIAHPNPDWAAEIKDLSHLKIVQYMIQGHTGVIEFFSPFVKQVMIAGYTFIPELGWGIMVPQPKSEIAQHVNAMLYSFIIWSVIGIVIAASAAFLITRWITRPVNQLASNALKLSNNDTQILHPIPANSPREVQQLATSIGNLFKSLCTSNKEINRMNQSLQTKIDKATADLISANKKLATQAGSDHLTTIANRRHFETRVTDILNNPDNEMIGIMLVDIDNFKQINDSYGHAAGDYVLTTVAKLLRDSTRPGDIIARYGGDEFVAEFRCDEACLKTRAEQLRYAVESFPFQWHAKPVKVTLSIGLICKLHTEVDSLDQLMNAADHAMYLSKQAGRNRVSILSAEVESAYHEVSG